MRATTDSALDTVDADLAEVTTDRVEAAAKPPERTSGDEPPVDITSEAEAEEPSAQGAKDTEVKRRIGWPAISASRALVFGILPILALALAASAAFFKWQESYIRNSAAAGIESLAAAKESTVALLSYQPATVEKDLAGARNRLTGPFKESYSQLIHDVVIPGAKKQHIAAVATVAAASSVSSNPNHAVALLFVNQTVTIGDDSPSQTESAVRVTLDKSGNRWLISGFDPV